MKTTVVRVILYCILIIAITWEPDDDLMMRYRYHMAKFWYRLALRCGEHGMLNELEYLKEVQNHG